jgi:hypothetical protein
MQVLTITIKVNILTFPIDVQEIFSKTPLLERSCSFEISS